MAWLRFSFFRFEPTCKVLRNFGLRLHRPLHQIRPALADRTALAVKTRPNSRPLIEWLGYFRYWQIVLKKSSLPDERKFLGQLMRFVHGDVRDHIISPKIDHGPS